MNANKLRPCEVTIYGEEEVIRYANGKRKVNKITPDIVFRGYFHMWKQECYVVGESPLVGGHSAGQISHVTALVEREDGTICEVAPRNVRFTDRQKEPSAHER